MLDHFITWASRHRTSVDCHCYVWTKNRWVKSKMLVILYTALNSPSLNFALQRSEIDSPSLEFALSPICYIIFYEEFNSHCFEFALRPKGENKTGAKFSLYTVTCTCIGALAAFEGVVNYSPPPLVGNFTKRVFLPSAPPPPTVWIEGWLKWVMRGCNPPCLVLPMTGIWYLSIDVLKDIIHVAKYFYSVITAVSTLIMMPWFALISISLLNQWQKRLKCSCLL